MTGLKTDFTVGEQVCIVAGLSLFIGRTGTVVQVKRNLIDVLLDNSPGSDRQYLFFPGELVARRWLYSQVAPWARLRGIAGPCRPPRPVGQAFQTPSQNAPCSLCQQCRR